MSTSPNGYKRYRFTAQAISHAIWLYPRLRLSLREMAEMLIERWIDVSYQTIRRWLVRFGPEIPQGLRRRQAHTSDVWHLDEVLREISGRVFGLWRAVDRAGLGLDEILRSKRDKPAAKRLLKCLIKRSGLPRQIVTDKLRSYGDAKRGVAPGLEHRSPKGLHNRAERRRLRLRNRARSMQGTGGLRRYVSCRSTVRSRFAVSAAHRSALQIRCRRLETFDIWKTSVGLI